MTHPTTSIHYTEQSNIRPKDFHRSFFIPPSVTLTVPPWIMKCDGLESSGQRLISWNSKYKWKAFLLLIRNIYWIFLKKFQKFNLVLLSWMFSVFVGFVDFFDFLRLLNFSRSLDFFAFFLCGFFLHIFTWTKFTIKTTGVTTEQQNGLK